MILDKSPEENREYVISLIDDLLSKGYKLTELNIIRVPETIEVNDNTVSKIVSGSFVMEYKED